MPDCFKCFDRGIRRCSVLLRDVLCGCDSGPFLSINGERINFDGQHPGAVGQLIESEFGTIHSPDYQAARELIYGV